MTSSVSDLPRHSEATAGSLLANRWLFPLFLVLATFIVYHPAWHGGFLWDDYCVPHGPHDLGHYTLSGLRDIWFHPTHQYYPLTYTTCWLEYHLWGLNTTGFHLVNILLHSLSSVVVWVILRRLRVPGAWLAASIFALHPVNVESVAWISERKNTLSCFFFLCSVLAALKFWLPEVVGTVRMASGAATAVPARAERAEMGSDGERTSQIVAPVAAVQTAPQSAIRNPRYYWLAFGLFICALFSKTTTIPLPAVILLLVWWKRGEITWNDIKPSIPFFVVGVAVGLITHHMEHHLGAHGKDFQISLVDRCLIAGRSFWFYLGKLIWPHPVMFVYPRWKIAPSPAFAWLSLLAFVPLLIVLWLSRKSWGRPAFVALAYFGGMLFLMLGFFNIYFFLYSFVSDHFQYEACIGPIALFAAALTMAFGIQSKGHSPQSTVATTQQSSEADSALQRFNASTFQRFSYVALSACLLAVIGTLSWKQCHMYTNVETLWATTAEQNPKAFLAHTDLADMLMDKGQIQAAIQQYQISLALRVDPETCHNLGNAYLETGRPDQAIVYFRKAVEIDPANAIAYSDLGNFYLQKGQIDLAIQFMQKALQIEPDLPIACYNLGNAYAQEQRLDLAVRYWEKAIELEPDYPMPHNNLGNALLLAGQTAKAVEQWKLALQYEPDLTSALENLAWVLATSSDPSLRDGQGAIALAERANQLSQGKDPVAIRSLAAAFAENGQYADAVTAARHALELSRGNPGLTATIQEQLKYYENHQPYRDQSLGK